MGEQHLPDYWRWKSLARFRLPIVLFGIALTLWGLYSDAYQHAGLLPYMVLLLWLGPLVIYLVAVRSTVVTFVGGPLLLAAYIFEFVEIREQFVEGDPYSGAGFLLWGVRNYIGIAVVVALDLVLASYESKRRAKGRR